MASGNDSAGGRGLTATDRPGDESADRNRRRLFLALRPNEALRAQLDRRLRKMLPRGIGRRIPVDDLHITLVFIGQVSGDIRACIRRAAGEVQGRRFELVLDRIGHWRRPRILWLGPAHTPAELFALVGALRERVAECGIPPEDRPYQTHMTLARKVQRPPNLVVEPLVWPVDSFSLMESASASEGVRYRELAVWPLGG